MVWRSTRSQSFILSVRLGGYKCRRSYYPCLHHDSVIPSLIRKMVVTTCFSNTRVADVRGRQPGSELSRPTRDKLLRMENREAWLCVSRLVRVAAVRGAKDLVDRLGDFVNKSSGCP